MLKLMSRLMLSASLLPSLAYAADSLLLTGAESASGSSSYYYVGYLTPLEGSQIGAGFVQRFWGDYLTYAYGVGSDAVKAKAPGASYALGYQAHNDVASGGVFVGIDGRRTTLSPDDLSSKARGSQLSPVISLEGTYKVSPVLVSINTSYLTDTRAYWARVRLLSGTVIKFGPELSNQGDPTYHTRKIGLYVGDLSLSQEIKIGAKMGKSYTGQSSDTYIGIELVKLVK